VRWNRKFLHLWQLPEELIQGADFGPVLGHVAAQLSDQELFLATRQKLYQHPESTISDLLVLIDGRLVERYSQPLRIGSAIVGRFWSFRDNTERRKLEEEVRRQNRELEQRVSERTQSLEDANCELLAINSELELRRNEAEETSKKLLQLSSAVENCSASIVIADSLGLIEYVNPKFCEVTGYPRDEVIGRNPSLLKADGQPGELYRELWAALSAGREWNGDFCNRKKNGDIFWEHASISPIKSPQGKITNFVAVKEDITEQKRITGELLTAQQAALSANRAKSEFLANMSHEIRTPLSAIIGFSDLTLRTELQPRQHDYVQKILNAGDLLLSIINDILDFSKIEARQLEMEQIAFRLDTILANVTDIVQQKVVQKGLQLQITTAPDAPLSLIGDQHRLSQIIVNLLSNAVKFTEEGRVALETLVQERDEERIKLKFIVRDTGMGISDQLIKKLFQPFTQADGSTTRRFGGTGLGLSISKQLVQMMGGEIWCESKAGLGSTFFFTAWFGLDEQSATAQASSLRPSGGESLTVPDFTGSRILLAEDNEINMLLADEMLFETGAVMDHAINGQEAVRMVTGGAVRYDLVLMDLQMPILDGYQASRIIRNDSRFGGLPIVAMTAHAMTEVQQAVLEAGMSAMVTKPINRWNLLRVMQSFLHAPGASDPAGENTGAIARTNPDPAGSGLAGRSSAQPAPQGSSPPGSIDPSQISPILNQLLSYIKGSNGKAERYLDSYHKELAGLPRHDLSQVKACLKNFDFAAARRAILSLARQNDIQLSPEHTGEHHP
jgi:PAS domain S-box-containing protein